MNPGGVWLDFVVSYSKAHSYLLVFFFKLKKIVNLELLCIVFQIFFFSQHKLVDVTDSLLGWPF